MHGPTYMANPLACAVALASTEILAGANGANRWRAIEAGLRAGLEPARELPGVADVRVLGAIGVVQLDGPVDVAAATAARVEHGVWLRPFRDLVYAMPPYVTGADDLARDRGGRGGRRGGRGAAMRVLAVRDRHRGGQDRRHRGGGGVAPAAGRRVAVVKPAQTGVAPGEPGDVDEVRRLGGVDDVHELARYPDPLAPATAARAPEIRRLGARRSPRSSARWRTATWCSSRARAGCSCASTSGSTLADVAALLARPVCRRAAPGWARSTTPR